jgi:hypothetical protein
MIIILESIIGYVEFNNNFIRRNTTGKSVFVPVIVLTQFDPQILISDIYDGKIKY